MQGSKGKHQHVQALRAPLHLLAHWRASPFKQQGRAHSMNCGQASYSSVLTAPMLLVHDMQYTDTRQGKPQKINRQQDGHKQSEDANMYRQTSTGSTCMDTGQSNARLGRTSSREQVGGEQPTPVGGSMPEQPAIKNMLTIRDSTMATSMEGLVNQGAYKAMRNRLMTAPPRMLCMELYLQYRRAQTTMFGIALKQDSSSYTAAVEII